VALRQIRNDLLPRRRDGEAAGKRPYLSVRRRLMRFPCLWQGGLSLQIRPLNWDREDLNDFTKSSISIFYVQGDSDVDNPVV
jgi:hypothetical protein